jgi:hypothetical protein
MQTNVGSLFRIAIFISFIFNGAFARPKAAAVPGPVPAALRSAKTVFVSGLAL